MALHVGGQTTVSISTKRQAYPNEHLHLEQQFIKDFKPHVPAELQSSAFNKKDGKFTNYSTQACFLTYVTLYNRLSKGEK